MRENEKEIGAETTMQYIPEKAASGGYMRDPTIGELVEGVEGIEKVRKLRPDGEDADTAVFDPVTRKRVGAVRDKTVATSINKMAAATRDVADVMDSMSFLAANKDKFTSGKSRKAAGALYGSAKLTLKSVTDSGALDEGMDKLAEKMLGGMPNDFFDRDDWQAAAYEQNRNIFINKFHNTAGSEQIDAGSYYWGVNPRVERQMNDLFSEPE
jgi:hypothetical protein